jgi:transcriptional regulator with XRE-family HTH domain
MQESLARKLRVLRAERGITLQEAEELTGVTRETLGALEHGHRGAYTNTLQKIAEGYGITVGELLEEPAVPLAKALDTGQPQPSTGTVEEFKQKLARVLEPARAEVLHDFQAANRFFASEGIERDYSGPISEAEVEKRFVDEFSPEERATAFGKLALDYALVERANVTLQANFTRAQEVLRERGEKIAQLEEIIAKMEKHKLGREIEEIHVPERAESEQRGVRD